MLSMQTKAAIHHAFTDLLNGRKEIPTHLHIGPHFPRWIFAWLQRNVTVLVASSYIRVHWFMLLSWKSPHRTQQQHPTDGVRMSKEHGAVKWNWTRMDGIGPADGAEQCGSIGPSQMGHLFFYRRIGCEGCEGRGGRRRHKSFSKTWRLIGVWVCERKIGQTQHWWDALPPQ